MATMMDNIEKLIDSYGSSSLEGRRGVVTLARICQAIGYKDPMHQGQMDTNACLGDIILFLEDNSGAIENMIEWIAKRKSHEWMDNIQRVVGEDDDEDEDDED